MTPDGLDWVLKRPEAVAIETFPPRPAVIAPWPQWVSQATRERLAEAGIPALWAHQAASADALYAGRHLALITPTASGKSLGYLLPVMTATSEGRVGAQLETQRGLLSTPRHTALYLAPTKALAHDQARAAKILGPKGWWVVALDKDSSQEERRFAREQASFVLTNPDVLHYALLPNHQRWASFLRALRYIIVDEAHHYQGLFGAHVANVLRRLRRLAAHYGASPTVALSSATMPNAAEFATSLTGVDQVTVVAEDASPAGQRSIVLWQPTGSLRDEAAALLSQIADAGHQAIAFVSSRQAAELITKEAQSRSGEPSRIAAYRGGFLALDRRELEAGLHHGRLRALVSTAALELGVDIAGMAAVLVCGYPGKLAAFWQQAGRAGRRGQDALVVLLARENPLDAYLIQHPELIFTGQVEPAVLHPDNPRVLGPHLAAAAYEAALTTADQAWFGPATTHLADALVAQRVLRDRGGRRYWTRPQRPTDFISLRAVEQQPFEVIEATTGKVLSTVDEAAADRTIHEGAIYLHQGETYLVKELNRDEKTAIVAKTNSGYYTQPQSWFDIEIIDTIANQPLGATTIYRGEVWLESQVVKYLRRDVETHEVWDATVLDLPRRRMRTQALWWTVPEELLTRLGWAQLEVGAAAHAIEHAAIGLLPAFAPCDRWDIGGVSTARHADTALPTIFVHDGVPGGAGFAYRGYEVAQRWLTATLARLAECRCAEGCPACVVSPKCGNANQALDKQAAAELLTLLLSEC